MKAAKPYLRLFATACMLLALSYSGFAGERNYGHLIDSLKQVIPNQTDTALLASIVQLDAYVASSAPKDMLPYLEQGLQVAEELEHFYYHARMLDLMGTAYYYLADYERSKLLWLQAVEVCERVPEEEYHLEVRLRLAHSTAFMNLGVISRMRGDYPQALDYYQQCLDIRKTTGYKAGVAACYMNIAKVYVDNKNDDRALEYYLLAEDIFEDHPNELYQAGLLNNIALVYQRQQKVIMAEDYFNQSLAMYQKLEEPKRVSQTYVNLGILYNDILQCEKALDFFSLALIINKEIHDRLGIAWCYQYIGECYSQLNQNDEALSYFHRALEILEELKVARNQLATYQGLAKIYANLGNFQAAYEYHQKFADLNNSVYTEHLSQQLAEQEARYAMAEKEKQLAVKDLEIERQTGEIAKNRIEKWALIIGILLVVAVAIIFIQRFRIEARYHKRLENQNEELRLTYDNLKATVVSKEEKEVMIKEIHHRVKNNLQIISSLVNLQANTVDDKHVRHMFREVQNRIISMALLHEQLYRAPDLANVNVREYLDELLDNLMSIFADRTDIRIINNIEVDSFGVDTLIPIGLLVNEVVTNSLKYAFKGREKGTITLEMGHLDGNKYTLLLADDGVGQDSSKLLEYRESLGMELIQAFVNQLDGEVEMSVEDGTRYEIVFMANMREEKLLQHSGVPAL